MAKGTALDRSIGTIKRCLEAYRGEKKDSPKGALSSNQAGDSIRQPKASSGEALPSATES